MSVCCCCFNLNDPHLLNRALIVNVLLDTFILNDFFVFLFFTIVHGVDSQQCVSLQQSQTEWLLEQPEKLYFVRRTEDFQHHTLWNGRSSTTCRYSLRGHTRPGPGPVRKYFVVMVIVWIYKPSATIHLNPGVCHLLGKIWVLQGKVKMT